MPTKGQILTIPANGNSYEYLETARDSNGKHVVMRGTLKQKGPNVPNHIHTLQVEEFEVISGKLTVWGKWKYKNSFIRRKKNLP